MSHTLETIAKLAGVSRGTVSRVVNNQPGVRSEVREKVLRIIKETGYQPHAQARSLAGGKTENIGIVVFGQNPLFLAHHLFYEVLQGVQSFLTNYSYDLLLYSNRSVTDRQYWKRIGDRRKVDGLIIMGEYIDEVYLQYYYDRNLPYVLVGKRISERIPLFCVTSDYRQGAYEATKHLLEQGRRKIVFIRGILDTYHDNERFAGYRQALAEAGMDVDEALILHGNADKTSASGAVAAFLATDTEFDAIFAGNDLMAFGAITALQEYGLSVPQDVAVIGYDDIQAAEHFSPPLSTVRQDKLGLGVEAARLLLQLLAGETDASIARDVIIPNQLVIRSSSVR